MSSTADVTDATTGKVAPTPDDAERISESREDGPMLAADGTPLKKSLRRAERRQRLRALALVAPLLLFILVTFVAPIVDMLLRSVDNSIVPNTVPRTVEAIDDWDPDSGELPGEAVFEALYFDIVTAAEAKEHTSLGSRLNYEYSGMSSLFRGSGRDLDDIGEAHHEAVEEIAPEWDEEAFWFELMAPAEGEETATDVADQARERLDAMQDQPFEGSSDFEPAQRIASVLPLTAQMYTEFALLTELQDEDNPAEEDPWESVFTALVMDLKTPANEAAITSYDGPGADVLKATFEQRDSLPNIDIKAAMIEAEEDWSDLRVWQTISRFDGYYTSGYFLNAVDMQPTVDGPEFKPEFERIYLKLFWRTLVLSVTITVSCILLGYPVAYLLATLPLRTSNLLMILVLLPFWTSLLVRTSAWIVLLQSNGVVNDILVNIGVISDDNRLQMMFNEIGTVVAMTHILLPFMILPLYSVMKTIPPSYVRAAKSLGATDWTAFWRVYFPNSVPGIGAGAILVFILAIGYYITPELVGGTSGIFISNRIAYHISTSLNWGLAAALGTILLFAVLILYWCYDKIVGIDNVKLG